MHKKGRRGWRPFQKLNVVNKVYGRNSVLGVLHRGELYATDVKVEGHYRNSVIVALLGADKLLHVGVIKDEGNGVARLYNVNAAEGLVLKHSGAII